MTDRYVPMGYAAPPAAPRMSYYAEPQQAPQQVLPPVPPGGQLPGLYQPPSVGNDSYGSAQPMPYDPNASPTQSWEIGPMPSNVVTPLDPNKGKTLDEITPMRGWRGY